MSIKSSLKLPALALTIGIATTVLFAFSFGFSYWLGVVLLYPGFEVAEISGFGGHDIQMLPIMFMVNTIFYSGIAYFVLWLRKRQKSSRKALSSLPRLEAVAKMRRK